jgi:transposase InsO family protein
MARKQTRDRRGSASPGGGAERGEAEARGWESLAELREAVVQWLHVHNHVRPHEALGWMTPAEKRAENLGVEFNQAA